MQYIMYSQCSVVDDVMFLNNGPCDVSCLQETHYPSHNSETDSVAVETTAWTKDQ